MTSIAIIGSAGRGTDAGHINADIYDYMYREALNAIREHDIDEAVSGGAAFADHVAVSLFLKGEVKSLRLYLPAIFNGRAYIPNPRIPSNPGKTTNEYHEEFRKSCGVEGLSEIKEAISRGAKVEVYHGFKRRNLEVATNCTHMIAFTFGEKPTKIFFPNEDGFISPQEAGLKDRGGTAHTWGECWKADWKKHVNLRERLNG